MHEERRFVGKKRVFNTANVDWLCQILGPNPEAAIVAKRFPYHTLSLLVLECHPMFASVPEPGDDHI
jgi:hypothetical protein